MEEVVLVAMAQMVNHRAEAAGVNGKMNRAVKSFIKLRHRRDGSSFIQVSTLKELFGPKYELSDVGDIRSGFIHQGMMTIEFRATQTSVMIREANPAELQKLLENINLAKKASVKHVHANHANNEPIPSGSTRACKDKKSSLNRSEIPGVIISSSEVTQKKSSQSSSSNGVKRARSPSDSSRVNANAPKTKQPCYPLFSKNSKEKPNGVKGLSGPELVKAVEMRKTVEMLKSKVPGFSRARSPEMSKIELALIKNKLKNHTTSLKITTKQKYFDGLPSELRNLTVNGINLRKIDDRLLILKNLVSLDLSSNSLKSVYPLMRLESCLQVLNVSNNNIEKLHPNWFDKFESLSQLDLSSNKLTLLPNSLVNLNNLNSLNVSRNQLSCLPFNLHFMRNLRTLIVNDNCLSFLPGPLSRMHLMKVNVSDNPELVRPSDKNNTGTRGLGEIGVPTLLEITAKFFLNEAVKREMKGGKLHHKLAKEVLPASLCEYLSYGKKCKMCRNMSFQYYYKMETVKMNSFTQEAIADSHIISVKEAICDKC